LGVPILVFCAVLLAPASAFACGGPGQACCSGNVCTSPAICDPSTICVLNNQQSCTSNSDCLSGLCANTSSTPSCGSEECLSAAGGNCSSDADCEPGNWCETGHCAMDSTPGGSCAADGPDECVTFLCDSMTQTCLHGAIGLGCTVNGDCMGTLHCCTPGKAGCVDSCTTADGWCCVPSGSGSCTVPDEVGFCCSGSCNGGTGICN